MRLGLLDAGIFLVLVEPADQRRYHLSQLGMQWKRKPCAVVGNIDFGPRKLNTLFGMTHSSITRVSAEHANLRANGRKKHNMMGKSVILCWTHEGFRRKQPAAWPKRSSSVRCADVCPSHFCQSEALASQLLRTASRPFHEPRASSNPMLSEIELRCPALSRPNATAVSSATMTARRAMPGKIGTPTTVRRRNLQRDVPPPPSSLSSASKE